MKSSNAELEVPLRGARQAILDSLKRHGSQPASQLAQRFKVTAMAVRQHLYILQEEGLVSARSKPKGRGRPTKVWALTETAQNLFPDTHRALAVELLAHMRAQFGEEGLSGIIDRHSEVQVSTYRRAVADAKSLEARLKALARIRSKEGYMAQVERQGTSWLLIENHCPICSAAKTCTRLCANELMVFQRVLGADVQILRVEHVLDGSRRCAYRVLEC